MQVKMWTMEGDYKHAHIGQGGASAPAWLRPGGPPRLAGGGAGQTTGRWPTRQAERSALRLSAPFKNNPKILHLRAEIFQSSFIVFFGMVDVGGPAHSGLGRTVRSASTSGGGRPAIQRQMNSVLLRLAKRRRRVHVRSTYDVPQNYNRLKVFKEECTPLLAFVGRSMSTGASGH